MSRTMVRIMALAVVIGALPGPIRAADMLAVFPARVGDVALDGETRAYDSKTIVDYMDGAADAYFRFAFKQLYQATYKLGQNQAIVEVFDMSTGPEAYGIYSMDLKGQNLAFGQGALRTKGMLRCWKGSYFIKIYSVEDSEEFQAFSTILAKHFATSIGANGAMPPLCATIPKSLSPGKFRFLHECDDMNEVHYLSTENVLELDKNTSVAFAECIHGGKRAKAAVAQYAKPADREKAWRHFNKTVFSKMVVHDRSGASFEEIRKGSVTGIRKFSGRSGEPMLALCVDAKSVGACRAVLNEIVSGAKAK